MARIIVTAERGRTGSGSTTAQEVPVMLDEQVSSIHLCDGHAAEQLIERLAWAVTDAEDAERTYASAGSR